MGSDPTLAAQSRNGCFLFAAASMNVDALSTYRAFRLKRPAGWSITVLLARSGIGLGWNGSCGPGSHLGGSPVAVAGPMQKLCGVRAR